VIGNGMVGVRLLEDLLTRAPDRYAITVFGAEPVPAYNRIALSEVLSGELRAARRDLLAALQSHTTSDLLRPGVAGEPCGRDVLLRMAAWLHELAHLIPDLATYGYQHGEPCDPGPDWSTWTAAQFAPHHTVRPEAAVARVVTAHARLLAALDGLDDAGLRRRGPTRFGFETSGWDLLVAEAAHERDYATRLMARPRQPACEAG
jgi:hypothetical protein